MATVSSRLILLPQKAITAIAVFSGLANAGSQGEKLLHAENQDRDEEQGRDNEGKRADRKGGI